MTLISKAFADEMAEKDMRVAYMRAQLRTRLAQQIRTIRTQREMTQADFAAALGISSQSTANRYEQIDYGSWTFKTLVDIAAAFDVGLMVEFVPYEEFLQRSSVQTPHRLEVEMFSREALDPLTKATPPPVPLSEQEVGQPNLSSNDGFWGSPPPSPPVGVHLGTEGPAPQPLDMEQLNNDGAANLSPGGQDKALGAIPLPIQ